MKLGYSYRLSQYAFGLGLLALVLAGGFVFFLNLITLRTERYQTQLTARLTRTSLMEAHTDTEPTEQASPSPEFSPPPDTRQLPRLAAVQTVQMLKPLAFYLVLTGGACFFLRGTRPSVSG